ncbi:uncharacterized protein LOC107048581 isoform X2 [Diachasma alloeum]|uniref:uncharacterized protein LOC107048581 isoform X2 n=1 Tax=Diachasma alloeum TaxID=454923 RepID=UPI0007383C1E|nr:uncharacterized protein LOC107048581 isoform X2 [Diachasma alloeum]
MVLKLMLLAVIFTAVYAEILNANDAQTCLDLCNSCQGTGSFVDGRCECYVPDGNDEQGECMTRIKRQADDLGMDFMDCEAATAERPARCNLRTHHIRTSDAQRIANYYMKGVLGSPMVQPQCDTDNAVSAPNVQTQTQPEPVEYPDSQLSFSPNSNAHYSASDSIVGAPLLSTLPYNYPHILHRQQSLRIPHPHGWPQSLPLKINPVHPPLYLHSPLHSPLHYSLLSPLHSPLHYSLISPLQSHLRHPILGASQMEEPTENIVSAAHKSYIPPIQMIKERPQMLAAPRPIVVQPGYSPQPRVAAPLSNELLTFLQQTLVHQNAILEAIQRHLDRPEVNLSIPRVIYPPEESKLGAPAPKFCPGHNKFQESVLGSPKKTECNKQRAARMSPAIETLVEGIPKIQKMDEMEHLEKIGEIGNEQLEKNEKLRRDETSERPLRETRPNVNGRQRKRELKKIVESKSA